MPPYSLSFGPESIKLEHEVRKEGEQRFSEQSRKLASVVFERLPSYGDDELTYHFGPPPKETPTPFWTVHRTSVREDANMEVLYVTVTISIGLSLEIPASVADRDLLNHMKDAFQSDVQYKVKIPIICNFEPLQRGEILKLFVPVASLAAPLLAARDQTMASVVEPKVPPPPLVAVSQNVAKATSVVTTKGAKGKGKKRMLG